MLRKTDDNDASKTAFVIVDMQDEFVSYVPKNVADDVISKIIGVSGHALFDVIIATRFVNMPESLYVSELGYSGCMEEDESTRLVDGIANIPNIHIIDKHGYGSTELIQSLIDKNVKTAYVCGMDTDACVLEICYGLFDADIRPVVLSDCVTSSGGEEYNNMALSILRRNIGEKNVIGDSRIIMWAFLYRL